LLDNKESRKVYQEILIKINQIMEDDGLKIGDKLPSERELAERLQVGRSSVREALRALELLGIIITKQGEGTFIQDPADHRFVDILAFYILHQEKSKKDLLEMRKIIELDAIRLATKHVTDEQLEEMKMILNEAENKWDKKIIPEEEEYRFHQLIAKASHNSILYKVWGLVIAYGKPVIKQSLIREGRIAEALSEHWQVYYALAEHNMGKAEEKMKDHLEHSLFYA